MSSEAAKRSPSGSGSEHGSSHDEKESKESDPSDESDPLDESETSTHQRPPADEKNHAMRSLSPPRSSREDKQKTSLRSSPKLPHWQRQRFASMDENTELIAQEVKAIMRSSESTDELIASTNVVPAESSENRNSSAPAVMQSPQQDQSQTEIPKPQKRHTGPVSFAEARANAPRVLWNKESMNMTSISFIQSEASATPTPLTSKSSTKLTPHASPDCMRRTKSQSGFQRGGGSRGASSSPRLLKDLGPVTQTPTRYPSPRANRAQPQPPSLSSESSALPSESADLISSLGFRSDSKTLVENDISRIRELYPIVCIEEEDSDDLSPCT